MSRHFRLITSGTPDFFATGMLTLETRGEGFSDITRDARSFIAEIGARDGTLTLFVRHTSASLTIQENADPDVQVDLTTALRRVAPQNAGWVHSAEGPDDMPAHIRAMLTDTSLQVPVINGELGLGTWQGVYLIEHRARAHRRELMMHFIGTQR